MIRPQMLDVWCCVGVASWCFVRSGALTKHIDAVSASVLFSAVLSRQKAIWRDVPYWYMNAILQLLLTFLNLINFVISTRFMGTHCQIVRTIWLLDNTLVIARSHKTSARGAVQCQSLPSESQWCCPCFPCKFLWFVGRDLGFQTFSRSRTPFLSL